MSDERTAPAGPMAGLRIIELAHERGDWAGKLFADAGAEVIKVEPPGGDATRGYAPFIDDTPDGEHEGERSLYFWHNNTSKRGVTLDLELEQGRELFARLVRGADMLIESEPPGRMAALGLDYDDLRGDNAGLIMVSITPFGRDMPRSAEAATDLTLLAGGGPGWSCGYDDHSLPPVRGGGNQGYQTGCHFAVLSALVALLHRDATGVGQHIDVNMHAAANVTTEAGSYHWLVAEETVQRQTGRHAGVNLTQPSQVLCSDGRYVNSGFPARRPEQFRLIHEWMGALGIRDDFELAPLIEVAMERQAFNFQQLAEDEELRAIVGAAREAMNFIATRLTAYEFFTGCQQRGFQVGIIYSPEEVMEDPHFVERGFPVQVEHPEFGRTVTYPGAPYQFKKTPWAIQRRAPLLGEDNEAVYGDLGLSAEEIAGLSATGVI